MGKNEELKKLYEKYWDHLEINAYRLIENEVKQKNKPANPLLLKIDEKEFEDADLKVMIVGQETRGWNGDFGKSIEEGMSKYKYFFIEENFYNGWSKSAFWKAFYFYKNELDKYYYNNKITYIWNNISKIGRNNASGITKKIRNLGQSYFPVFKEEIKILQPDIIIFLTGNRNNDLKFSFHDITFTKYHNTATLFSKNGKRKFKPVYQIASKYLPIRSVKIYHPSFFGGFNDLRKDALEVVTQNFNPPIQVVSAISEK